MSIKMKFAGVALATTFGLSGATALAETATLKFGVWTPEAEMTYQRVMKPFAERAMKDSDGTLKIELYPGGALGRNPAMQLKFVDDGVMDIAWHIPAYNPGVFTDDSVFELPNIIQNSTEGSKAAWRLYERGMLAGYDRYKMLGLFVTAPYTIHTSKKVTSMDDLKGMKIRAVGPTMIASVNTLGAAAEPMPFGQIVEGISRGVIDGTTGHPIAVHDFGPAKVTRYHYMNNLGTVTLAIFMSRKSYDALPAKAREAIDKNSGEVLSKAFGEMSDVRNAELLEEWQKDRRRTVTVPSADEVKRWNETLAPVVADWRKNHKDGEKLLGALEAELAKIRAGN